MESSEFVIGTFLGEGDSSKVYLCTKKNSDEKYAMKIFKRGNLDLKSYEYETKLLSKVSHANIIKWIKSEINGDNLCIITECFPGKTLRYVIKKLKRPFNRNEIIPIFIPLMSALSYLHSLNIMHGDVDIGNIMIKFGKSKNVEAVKLIDFAQLNESLISDENNCQIDVIFSGIVLLYMIFGINSEEVILKAITFRLRPELLIMILKDVNPFFRNLIVGMMSDDHKNFTSHQVLRFLHLNSII